MIPNRWYAVLDSREVPKRRPVSALRLGERLVLWRDESGRVCCAAERCAHRGAALSAGKVVEGCVECPFHGFRYDADGRCRLIPANGRSAEVPPRFKVASWPVREAHGFVWLWHGERPAEGLPEPAFFDDLEGLHSTGFRDRWPVHYSRAVENQLDVMHLPFTHATTIGRGGRTLVDGPLVEWLSEDRFRFHVFNRLDDGTAPRKAAELQAGAGAVYLDFVFPNLWQNHIADSLRVVAAFAPVDDANTVIYLRMYQKSVLVPGLREIFEWTMMRFNRAVLGQDRRVVVTQRPIATSYEMGEGLVQGDLPIVEYRRRRQELIDAAGGPA